MWFHLIYDQSEVEISNWSHVKAFLLVCESKDFLRLITEETLKEINIYYYYKCSNRDRRLEAQTLVCPTHAHPYSIIGTVWIFPSSIKPSLRLLLMIITPLLCQYDHCRLYAAVLEKCVLYLYVFDFLEIKMYLNSCLRVVKPHIMNFKKKKSNDRGQINTSDSL